MAPMKLSYKEPIFPEEFEYFKGAVDALYNRASRLNLNDAMISSRELRDKQEKLYLYSKDKFEFAEPVTMEFGDERTRHFNEKEIKLFDSVIFSCKVNFSDKVLVSLYLFQGELSYGKNAAYSGRFKNADHVKDFVFEIDNSDINNIVDEAEKFILQQFREKGLNPFDS